MKIVIYRRLSVEKKGKTQHGFDSQQTDINHFLKQQTSYEIVGEFKEFFSGKGSWTKRQEMVKAVEFCERTGATLLVSKVDRLGRDVESIAHLLKRINVRIATMPSASNMTIQILAVMAEEESRAISSRIKAALAEVKRKGGKLGGSNPKHGEYQERVSADVLTRDLKHKGRLLAMKVKGLTLREIAERYNDMGYTTPRGKAHNQTSIKRMMDRVGV